MINKLPIELVYKIFGYLDYSLLYCKYFNYPLPNELKMNYIKKIKKDSRFYPSVCHHSFCRIDNCNFIFDPEYGFFESIFKKDCSIVYNFIGIKITTCSLCKTNII